jgi:hypothetical protein
MNNFAELSDGASAQFLVRWRGRQEGPYPAAVIEAKLAANEIGLLHEILVKGKWVTIRNYISEIKCTQESEQLAVEDEIKKKAEKRKESDQQQAQRHEEFLAEENRNKNILKLVVERKNHGSDVIRMLALRDMRFVYGAILIIIVLAAIGAYTFVQMKVAETARFQAEQQAKAIKAATEAQQKIEAMNAAASVVNTVINGAVEANKPVQPPPVIIMNGATAPSPPRGPTFLKGANE